MARIPKYCYRVVVSKKLGTSITIESHNYETLPGAWAYREIALGHQRTCKVEVMAVLDESTPSHKDEGIIHETKGRTEHQQIRSWRLADR